MLGGLAGNAAALPPQRARRAARLLRSSPAACTRVTAIHHVSHHAHAAAWRVGDTELEKL